jgi:hypothetical protein
MPKNLWSLQISIVVNNFLLVVARHISIALKFLHGIKKLIIRIQGTNNQQKFRQVLALFQKKSRYRLLRLILFEP